MSDNTLTLYGPLLPTGSTEGYLQRIQSIPMLSAEEEYNLAVNLQTKNDLQAAQKLIFAHLKFVVRVAKGYSGYGLQLADLIQEGSIGLMKAVKRYKPTKAVRLATFAVYWIKAEIQEYVIKNWRLVKIATTKAQRKLFFNLRKKRKDLGWLSENERLDLAKELNVPIKEVYLMEQRLNARDVSIYQPDEDSDDNHAYHDQTESKILNSAPNDPGQLLMETDFDNKTKIALQNSFNNLDTRSKKIINDRYMVEEKATLDTLATEFSISKERIRQLEAQAINLIQNDFSHFIE